MVPGEFPYQTGQICFQLGNGFDLCPIESVATDLKFAAPNALANTPYFVEPPLTAFLFNFSALVIGPADDIGGPKLKILNALMLAPDVVLTCPGEKMF